MHITDEKLSAFIDGELSPQEMTNIREHLSSDDKLAHRVESLLMLDKQVKSAISSINETPVPAAITELANKLDMRATKQGINDNNVVSLSVWQRARGQFQHYAIAAASITAVAGFILGHGLHPDAPQAVNQWQNIANVLETQPGGRAHKISDGSSITSHLTFKNQEGEYCRQFSVKQVDGHTTSNLACRQNGGWALEALVPVDNPTEQDEYQVASGGHEIDNIVDAMIDGQVLSAKQENTLVSKRWED